MIIKEKKIMQSYKTICSKTKVITVTGGVQTLKG